MKKRIHITVISLFLAGAVLSGASITVNKPNTLDLSWEIGSSKTIEWTTSGLSASDRLRISLMQGTNKIGTIANNVAIDASPMSWKVGDCIERKASIGENYYIKIKKIGAAVTGRNVHPFKIRLKFLVMKPFLKRLTVLALLPDLTVNVTYTLAPHHSEGYNESTFTITVTNIGAGASKSTTNVGAKLLNYGPDGTHMLSGHDAWWPETVPVLQPGESFSYEGKFSFRVPNFYKVTAWVDSEGHVQETATGETNNHFDTVKFQVP